ncbi:MAG: M3 family metallopeptidase [Bacteroidia bacterium]|nr:M3 family metallopeptidase [Bacteroidia bacterium]
MRKLIMIFTGLVVALGSAAQKNENPDKSNNPFFNEYKTPFQVPPFDDIKLAHFIPAIEEGIKQQSAEIDAIIKKNEAPDFLNTILPYDNSGELLSKVSKVFFNLNGANTNPGMQKLAHEISPKLTKHGDDISLNPELFKKIKSVYERRATLGLDADQLRVVGKIYNDFVRGGANLSAADQTKLRTLNEALSKLSLQFGENVLAETNKNFRLVVRHKKDLEGLSANVIEAAAIQASKDSIPGKWSFTLQKPSMLPFLQYAKNRNLREKLYRGYFMRGDNKNSFDNKEFIKKIVQLRDEKAKLMGYPNFAAFVIAENMAQTPENVDAFLQKLWVPALSRAKRELQEMQSIIDQEGGKFKLQLWDWWFYAEKLRKAKYDLDESEIKPYFSLENVQNGIFYVANKLYGITFENRNDIPIYNTEVVPYEVKEANGSHLGVLYMDFHPRDGKRAGAWCTTYRTQKYRDGKRITPVVSMVMNFTRPAGAVPALLSFDEVTTMFHEFGHALHRLFQDQPYDRTAGDVPRDFVELPSQIMENWASEPEVLKVYARHYQTGGSIPDALIAKLEKSRQFNQGFETVEYLAASILDMKYHTLVAPAIANVRLFEKDALAKEGLIPEILPRYRSTYFSHIFSGGYSAGYYVYIWAAVLDADAFQAFKESGDLFNPALAAKFRELLTKSGSDDGMKIYTKFRGKAPDIKSLLQRRGLE